MQTIQNDPIMKELQKLDIEASTLTDAQIANIENLKMKLAEADKH